MAGEREGDWLNREWIRRIAETAARGHCRLLVVQWSRRRTESDGARTRLETPLRARRLLRVIALRLQGEAGGVIAWKQSGPTLVLLASLPNEAWAGSFDESGGRFEHHLRDTIRRAMSGERGARLADEEGTVRCGSAALKLPGRLRGEEGGMPQEAAKAAEAAEAAAEEALWTAWHRAWQQVGEAAAVWTDGAEADKERDEQARLEVRYAPIVSLLDGSLYAYEAVPCRGRTGRIGSAVEMFAAAEAAGKLYEFDRSFREAAIRGLPARGGGIKLFLPVSAAIMYDARLYPGTTLRRIEAAGIRPERVVLVFHAGEQADEREELALRTAFRHYRAQGFRIALAGATIARESLLRLLSLHPDYAMVDVGWLANAGGGDDGFAGQWADAPESDAGGRESVYAPSPGSGAEETLLRAIAELARKEQIIWLASGVDREAQLGPLVASGAAYGQGSWIGPAEASPPPIEPAVRDRIRLEVGRRYRRNDGSLAKLTTPADTFARLTPVSEVARQFELRRDAHAFVIAEEGRPVGLLMKEKLHQLLSGQFGLALYWNRPVEYLMDAQPLIVDEATPIDQVSQMAMAREPDKLYDAVVVTRDGLVRGVASIRSLLEWVTTLRMTDAQSANPLTGLPGNEPIRRELLRRFGEGKPFAVLYADLDYFKWFNDRFGFRRGDEAIRFTADALTAAVRASGQEDAFVGHIGGDDFIATIACEGALKLAESVLKRFERGLAGIVEPDAGPVVDRDGRPADAEGLSLSLSLLLCEAPDGWTPERLAEQAAFVKKRAKRQRGHSLAIESLGLEPSFAETTMTKQEWSVPHDHE